MKSMIKDAVILFVITVIAGLILGFIFQLTKGPIAAEEQAQKMEACKNVFADAATFETKDGFSEEDAATQIAAGGFKSQDVNEVMTAKDASGSTIGYVVTVTSHEGYAGDIKFSMGIKSDGTLNGISLLSIAETAGLGMKADDVLVPQFKNKKVEKFSYIKNSETTSDDQIQAISGATITTNAMTNAVNAGMYYFQNALEGGSAK